MTKRLPWIDHLRTFAIFLVVIQHACVTYSHIGSWYVLSGHAPTPAEQIVFILWEGHAQAFFMGLLFFVSGYFAHGSLQRRGPGPFLRERLVRLGLPTLLFMLVVHPFILLALNPWNAKFPPVVEFYAGFVGSGRFLSASGPLWFAFALLIFCAAFAGWSAIRPPPPAPPTSPPPGPARLWLFAAGLVVSSFAVRLVFPLGSSVMNFQLPYFPQYVAAFVAGLAAARHGWLLSLAASATAMRAGWFALVGGPLAMLAIIVTALRVPANGLSAVAGGWRWPALELALWEQLAGLGLALGLLALFSRRLNVERPALRWLGDRSFGVYVFHTPVLVGFTMLFRPLEAAVNPLALAALLATSGLVVGFVVADLARRIPGLRAIL